MSGFSEVASLVAEPGNCDLRPVRVVGGGNNGKLFLGRGHLEADVVGAYRSFWHPQCFLFRHGLSRHATRMLAWCAFHRPFFWHDRSAWIRRIMVRGPDGRD